MFNDGDWVSDRTDAQMDRLKDWMRGVNPNRLVIVELGAGTAVPTVRNFCERVAAASDALLLRINVREPEVPEGHLGFPTGALEALQAIDALFRR